MSRRRVRPDELELWQQVARTADPLVERPFASMSAPETKRIPDPPAPEPVPAFRVGETARKTRTAVPEPQSTTGWLKQDPLNMDAKAFGRLKRGKLVPEARIDLHGMTLDQAHPELIRFILTSQTRGLRLVLVITGKGQREDPYDPMPQRRGVLKRQVPLWLKQSPASQAVLQISEAHVKHGGGGAYYVYLKRRR